MLLLVVPLLAQTVSASEVQRCDQQSAQLHQREQAIRALGAEADDDGEAMQRASQDIRAAERAYQSARDNVSRAALLWNLQQTQKDGRRLMEAHRARVDRYNRLLTAHKQEVATWSAACSRFSADPAAGRTEFQARQARAEAGDIESMRFMVQSLARGQGVARDPGKALYWLERAAQQGDPVSMHLLGGTWLSGGLGNPVDHAKGTHWVQAAAKAGHVDSMFLLASVLANGAQGVPQDMGAAVHWLGEAARLGHAQAQQVLNQMEPGARPR